MKELKRVQGKGVQGNGVEGIGGKRGDRVTRGRMERVGGQSGARGRTMGVEKGPNNWRGQWTKDEGPAAHQARGWLWSCASLAQRLPAGPLALQPYPAAPMQPLDLLSPGWPPAMSSCL